MSIQKVSLSPHHEAFVEERVRSGHYDNAGEVIRAGLRLLETQEQARELKLERLRREARIGFNELDQGQGIALQPEEVTAHVGQLADQVKARRTP